MITARMGQESAIFVLQKQHEVMNSATRYDRNEIRSPMIAQSVLCKSDFTQLKILNNW